MPVKKFILEKNKKLGFIFLEILVATAILSLVFVILLGIGLSSLNSSSSTRKEIQADYLIREEFEAIRSLRDGTTWATNGLGTVNFTDSNPYYLFLDSSANPARWSLQTGTETAGDFTRYVVFDKVSRNPDTHRIESVYNSSNNDADTLKVTVTISWTEKITKVTAYLTNWKTND